MKRCSVYLPDVFITKVSQRRISVNGFNDKLVDVLVTVLGLFVGKRRHSNQFSSISSLSQAAKLMKGALNKLTHHCAEIELTKAYLYCTER